jgi:hypothetical protein
MACAEISRKKLSPEAKKHFEAFCKSDEIHSELNVTYKDVAERALSWLSKQPIETWNEVITILDTEIKASADKCFTGRLSRLISCLDGFHPGVRVSIATSDQISNRVLMAVNKAKDEGKSNDEIIVIARKELEELDLEEDKVNEWMETVKETLLD